MTTKDTVIKDILIERYVQDTKYGSQPQNWKPTTWLAILSEELGEVARAIIQHDKDTYRKELIQLAAVAIAAIEDLDTGEPLNSVD
jgi:NTP pyrophosphatase (non-canonical NTP hydrolase)